MIVRLLSRLAQDRRGGTAIEYGLIAALVIITMIGVFMQVANSTTSMWGMVSTKVTTTAPAR